ncbi:MAG: hypothetical protein H6581_09635 [Bacteroidia bacterium]|nr:hypothetical protein [Bacteroidia bacterium]
MKKLMFIKCFVICLGLFFAVGSVSAQQVTGNNPGPASKTADQAKKEMMEKSTPDYKKQAHYTEKAGVTLLPGYVATGNKAVDEANYQAAKAKFIKDNEAEYHRLMKLDASNRSGAITVTAKQVQPTGLH